MHPAKKVAMNTGFLYARMAITVFISLYSTRLILQALGDNDFGLFSIIGGAIAMLTFLNNAMATATQRFLSYANGEGNVLKQKQIFNVSIVLHFIVSFLVLIVLEVAGYFLLNGVLNIPEGRLGAAKIIYQFMVANTFFTIISVPYDAIINAHENMFLVAILGVIEAICKLLIAVYITYTNGDTLIIYGFLMTLLTISLLIIRRIYCHHHYDEVSYSVKKYFNKPLSKEIGAFAGWSLLGSASSMISNYGQGIVLNIFFGTKVNTAQGIAGQVSGQLGAFATTMMKALNPLIAKSEGSGNRSLMIEAVMSGSKISFFLLAFFFIPVMIEMPYIFNIWLENVPEFAIIFCQLLLIRNLVEQLFIALNSSILAHGKIKRYEIISSILSYLPLIISYILFANGYPAYHIYSTYIIYAMLASTVNTYFAWKNFNFPVITFLKNVVARSIYTFLIVLFIAYVPRILLPEGFVRLLIVTTISSFMLPIAIWTIGFDSIDRGRIKLLIMPALTRLYIKVTSN